MIAAANYGGIGRGSTPTTIVIAVRSAAGIVITGSIVEQVVIGQIVVGEIVVAIRDRGAGRKGSEKKWRR